VRPASRRGKQHAAVVGKRAHSLTLAATLGKLMSAGFVSQRALTNELNQRGIPTARGGNWHRSTVERMLARLGLITSGRINTALAHRQAADARAKSMAVLIRALQVEGAVTANAIARELNERKIPTARRGRWHPSSVERLLQRLKRLHRPSYRRHRR
jgi:hypothetical protein